MMDLRQTRHSYKLTEGAATSFCLESNSKPILYTKSTQEGTTGRWNGSKQQYN